MLQSETRTAHPFIAADKLTSGAEIARLSEQLALYRAIADMTTSHIMVLHFSPDDPERYKIAWTNAPISPITGYSWDELQALNDPQALIHPDDRAFIAQRLQVIMSGQADMREYRIRTRTGAYRWVRDYGQPLFDMPERRISGIVLALQDITEQVLAQQTLRESEQRYRNLVELCPDAIIVHCDGQIVFANPAAAHLLGYEQPQALLGHYILDLVAPEYHDFVRQRIECILNQGIITPIAEIKLVRNDGSLVDIEVSASMVLYNGRPTVQSLARDITGRKRLEEERLAMECKLQEAQRMESLGVLAGGIAHDFNNLLLSIIGNASLALLDLPAHAPANESIQQIEIAAQRAADLTRQMLTYAGRVHTRIEPLDINALLADLVSLLRDSVPNHITIRQELAPVLPRIAADVTQIRQVLMNLIINAAEAIGDHTGTIVITTHSCLAEQVADPSEKGSPRCYVYLKVSDDGCGMDKTTISRIFDPFFTTKFTGRGLGLAAVQGIIRSHKGSLQVESTPGRGTTFTIQIPVH